MKPYAFGPYLMLERLAIGGMAEVWLARNKGAAGFKKLVALKRILPNIAEDNEFIQMFVEEAKIAGQLAHANIAQIYDLGRVSQTYYIALEYVPGVDLRTLWDRVRNRGGFPLAVACHIVARLCEGLDYAHRRKDARGKPLGIIHRDVSPQNVLCSFDGDVKIIDFGIAKAANRAVRTQTGILKGKFAYMAPEHARGMPMDHRADIFAIGVILFELVTGERLFRADSDFSLLEKVRKGDVNTPRSIRPDTPPELEKIIMKALAARPEDRYGWASNLQADLERFLVSSRRQCSREDLAQFVRDHFPDHHKAEMHRQKEAEAAPDVELNPDEKSQPLMNVPGEGTTLFESGEVEPLTSENEALDGADGATDEPTDIHGGADSEEPATGDPHLAASTNADEQTPWVPGAEDDPADTHSEDGPFRSGKPPPGKGPARPETRARPAAAGAVETRAAQEARGPNASGGGVGGAGKRMAKPIARLTEPEMPAASVPARDDAAYAAALGGATLAADEASDAGLDGFSEQRTVPAQAGAPARSDKRRPPSRPEQPATSAMRGLRSEAPREAGPSPVDSREADVDSAAALGAPLASRRMRLETSGSGPLVPDLAPVPKAPPPATPAAAVASLRNRPVVEDQPTGDGGSLGTDDLPDETADTGDLAPPATRPETRAKPARSTTPPPPDEPSSDTAVPAPVGAPVQRVRVHNEVSIHSAATSPGIRTAGGGGMHPALVALALLLGIGAGMGIMAALVRTPVLGKGTLVVRADVPGAKITIDSRPPVDGPLLVEIMPAGTVKVAIEEARYRPDIQQVQVQPNAITEVKFNAVLAQGTLRIVTTPERASVYLDGKKQDGVTPMVIEMPPDGRHAILLRHPECQDEQTWVEAKRGEEFNVVKTLKYTGSRVVVDASPDDAVVMEGRDVKGRKSIIKVKLGERLELKVVRPGCDAQTLEVTGAGEETITEHVKLRCGEMDADFNLLDPVGAHLSINGIDTALTTPVKGYRVPSGRHQVELVTRQGKILKWDQRFAPGSQDIGPP